MKLTPKEHDEPTLSFFPGGSLLDVPEALAFLGIPDTPAAGAWMHDEFAPMPADEFMMIPRGEIEDFADGLIEAIAAGAFTFPLI